MYPTNSLKKNKDKSSPNTQLRLVRNNSRASRNRGRNISETDAQQLLSFHFPFLKSIPKEALRLISSLMVTQRFEKKEYIYLPYNTNEQIYFIKHGNVEIGYLDESGRELSLDILSQGEVFGSILNKGRTTGFARALSTTVVAILQKDDFEELLEKYPRFAYQILTLMGQRINSLENKLQNLVFSDVRTRICKLLYSLFKKSGDQRTGQIKIPLTHQDIANLVASSRETASLHLSDLKKSGVIAYERKRIRILSFPLLQNCIAH